MTSRHKSKVEAGHQRPPWLVNVLVIVIILLIAYTVVFQFVLKDQSNNIDANTVNINELGHNVDQLSDTVDDLQIQIQNGRVSRLKFQAKTLFVTCAKDDSTILAERRAEFNAVCEAYDTLLHSQQEEERNSPTPATTTTQPGG